MTPRTRSSNNDGADSKIYRSRKVPQQAYFPHKRKTVRRPLSPAQGGKDKRQMVFLPDKMRGNGTKAVKDSDDDEEDEDIEEQNTIRFTKEKSKKRGWDIMHSEDEDQEDNETVGPKRNRKRNDAASMQKRRRRQAEATPVDEHDEEQSNLGDSTSRRHVRQSTMTQLVEGRRPLIHEETEEPKFKPLKRSPRLSWGVKRGDKARDNKQRTLTQMVPGMRPIEVMSDEDMEEALDDLEAKDEDSQKYDEMVARRLANQGLHRLEDHDKSTSGLDSLPKEGNQSLMKVKNRDETVHEPLMSVENNMGLDEGHSYRPSQYIVPPATRTKRSSRRQTKTTNIKSHVAKTQSTISKSAKPRFGLLSTPEKRRVREIPSSQSPAESPLFTQTFSPYRSPLKKRSENLDNMLQTPSKRKKISFQAFPSEINTSRTLKKFRSVIQDSEDEDSDGIVESMTLSQPDIDARVLSSPPDGETHMCGKDIGAETQAVLEQIDQACAHMDEDISPAEEEMQQEVPRSSNASERQSCLAAQTSIKEEPQHNECLADTPLIGTTSLPEEQQTGMQAPLNDEFEPIQPLEAIPSTPPSSKVFPQDTLQSTPMMLLDESSDEEKDKATPVSSSRANDTLSEPATEIFQQLPDHATEVIQCPRSPSPHHETQQSHSSKAEQQLQNEWFSYSQYANTRPQQSSSMHATHDPFSHIATLAPLCQSSHSAHPSEHPRSQATTIDEVTPRKNRTQSIVSANVTPHRNMKSHSSLISPSKLPALCIPSSFPSPMEAGLDGWSSPAVEVTQAGAGYAGHLSWEEFSIPLPPPPEETEEP